ncbi:PucR family transcriptional regulator [Nocardiopsis eucommiae]|uniref:PucR family transcriptional regulator n=1 Tax=Nocardiopsis eucommiae TaxID=2831970 RepID=UPI003D702C2D
MSGVTDAVDSHHVPLSVVTGRRDLALETVVAAGDPAITWAVASEMVEPAAYLRGGELLLTAGVNLPGTPEGAHAYVGSLVRAGVGAVGFGVAPIHTTVPELLVEECRAQGLPLLEVPGSTPFAAVSRAVGEELAERHLRDVRRLGEAHQALARAVTAASPVERVLAVLADALGGWAALEPSDPAAPAHRTPGAPRAVDPALRPLLARLTAPSGPRGAKAPSGDDEVFLHTVGSPPEEYGVVLVGRPEPLGITDRAVLRTATALIDLLSRTVDDSATLLGGLLTGLLLDGELDEAARPLLTELTALGGRPDTTGLHRVLRARPPGARGRAGEPDPPLGTHLVDRVRRSSDDGPASEDTVRAVLADRGNEAHRAHLHLLGSHGWTVALSPPVPPSELPRADRQAAALLVRARASGAALLWADGTDPFDTLLDPAGADDLSRALLGPLARDTGAARSLRETLRAWLARHGNWDRAAADLGVHRNTVRYRIGRIERDLGVDLADAEQRMRLWFALTRHTGSESAEPDGARR